MALLDENNLAAEAGRRARFRVHHVGTKLRKSRRKAGREKSRTDVRLSCFSAQPTVSSWSSTKRPIRFYRCRDLDSAQITWHNHDQRF
jgi:hypothetical protein